MTSPTSHVAGTPAGVPSPVGHFAWTDLMTTDAEAAIRFYTAVTEWTITFWDMGERHYPMWTIPGAGPDASVGGVMAMPPGDPSPPHWLLHLTVPDCAAATARATALGATVLLAPQPIPTVGHFAVIRDPQGAVVSLFAPTAPMPMTMPPVGGFAWFELATTDRAAALDFYQALVGWEATTLHDMGDGMHYQLFRRPGDAWDLGGIYAITPAMPMPPAWIPYVRVASIDRAAAAVPAHGGQLLQEIMTVPGGARIVTATDPQGAMFALIEMP
jgi:predicted enzyme related to lactoylglutathione lyase